MMSKQNPFFCGSNCLLHTLSARQYDLLPNHVSCCQAIFAIQLLFSALHRISCG